MRVWRLEMRNHARWSPRNGGIVSPCVESRDLHRKCLLLRCMCQLCVRLLVVLDIDSEVRIPGYSSSAVTASVVLVSSNPTNLVLSGAFALKWTSYIAHVVLPFLGAAVTVYPLLLYMFCAPELIPASLDIDFDEVDDVRECVILLFFSLTLAHCVCGLRVGPSWTGEVQYSGAVSC